jgi:hypothetical protein
MKGYAASVHGEHEHEHDDEDEDDQMEGWKDGRMGGWKGAYLRLLFSERCGDCSF